MKLKRISVVGLGYIGLPTATVLASRGLEVMGVDAKRDVVETINRGEIHIVEPDLDIAVHSVVSTGHLVAHLTPQPADAFLIAVPTPFKDGHEPDLSYVEAAVRGIARVLRPGNVVILESTSPVGTTERVCQWLAESRPDLNFPHQDCARPDVRVAYCPERVLPGHILRELVENDRVIGGMTPVCAEAAADVYRVFVRGQLLTTDARTAEMVKLTENSFRDVNIAFANELSLICDRLGINVWELIQLANRHPRVNILQPGVGVGGHCIAVDPWFVVSQTPDIARIIRVAREVNDSKPEYVVSQIISNLKAIAEQPVVACLGLTFKPDVDDLRESPALKVVCDLAKASHLTVLAVEPHINSLPQSLASYGNVQLVTFEEAFERAHVIAGLVKHKSLVQRCNGRKFGAKRFLDYAQLLA